MEGNIRETRLPSGIVVISDAMREVRSATLGFFCRLGARHEPERLNGITHFIEHCVFKGTERHSARELAVMQDRLGGNLDAFTSQEETGFVLKITDDRIGQAFALLSEIITSPRFAPEDCLTERNVIAEEIKMNEDAPEEVLGDIFHKHFFPAHSLGLPITGTPETLERFDSKTVTEYHSRAFSPANLVITAAGNILHDELLELVNRLDFRPAKPLTAATKVPNMAAPIYFEQREDLEQVHVIVATPFVSARDDRRYAADLLAGVIGGGVSSRLWQKVREERGLAYSVGAASSTYLDCGFLSISAAVSPESFEEFLAIVVDELRWIVRNGITDEELELMKEQSRASILLNLEDSASRAATLAHFELTHGHQITVEESLAMIESVTPDEILKIAREYFRSENISVVAIGDLGSRKISRDFLEIRY